MRWTQGGRPFTGAGALFTRKVACPRSCLAVARMVAAVAFAALVAGCGGEIPRAAAPSCAEETRADTYVAGLAKTSVNGMYTVRLMDVSPGPPDQGNNRWNFVVEDASGQVINDASVTARPWMPDHGHGAVPLEQAARKMNDAYDLGPMNLFMPGLWTVTLTVERESVADDVVYAFCIEG